MNIAFPAPVETFTTERTAATRAELVQMFDQDAQEFFGDEQPHDFISSNVRRMTTSGLYRGVATYRNITFPTIP